MLIRFKNVLDVAKKCQAFKFICLTMLLPTMWFHIIHRQTGISCEVSAYWL